LHWMDVLLNKQTNKQGGVLIYSPHNWPSLVAIELSNPRYIGPRSITPPVAQAGLLIGSRHHHQPHGRDGIFYHLTATHQSCRIRHGCWWCSLHRRHCSALGLPAPLHVVAWESSCHHACSTIEAASFMCSIRGRRGLQASNP
jgi:hypothetical protein